VAPWLSSCKQARSDWPIEAGELLARFRQASARPAFSTLMTCAATPRYLPLPAPEHLRRFRPAAQAIPEHERCSGERPLGSVLPSARYYEGLVKQFAKLPALPLCRLDGHGLLHALARPRYGIYARSRSPAGLPSFGVIGKHQPAGPGPAAGYPRRWRLRGSSIGTWAGICRGPISNSWGSRSAALGPQCIGDRRGCPLDHQAAMSRTGENQGG